MVYGLANSKKWIMPVIDKAEALHISQECGVSPLVGEILQSRGFTCSDYTKKFLKKNPGVFHDPFLLNDMSKAVEIIKNAVENKLKIAIYGDYDVDGITSTFILYDYLSSQNANVMYYIPDRVEEGYGINTAAIDFLKDNGVQIIITVDVGITAVNEVKYASDKGIEVIVTDHHTLKDELPNAAAVINPKITDSGYPFDALAGVGVAFKLIYAVSGENKKIFDKYCDIVAIGTVADMVPLVDENRYIAAYGIEKLANTSNIGLKALMEVCGLSAENMASSAVGFTIAPRLNAAGRIFKAEMSVELLMEKDYKRAVKKAEQLNEYNRLRQKEEQHILDEALSIIKNNSYENDNFILVAKENWTHGVIGIVSSRITDMFYKPSAVVSINPDGTGKASGRSIKGINLFETLSACSSCLARYGGHELAAGFTIKKDMIDTFRKCADKYCKSLMTDEISVPSLKIDAVINLETISMQTVDDLKVLEPYGILNRSPMFCILDAEIKSVRYTQDGKHAFLTLYSDGCSKEAPAFSMADEIKHYKIGDYVSVAGVITVNNFRGNTYAQFVVKDIKEAEKNKYIGRNELAVIFGAVKSELEKSKGKTSKDRIKKIIDVGLLPGVNYSRLDTAIKIFDELNIVEAHNVNGDVVLKKGINFTAKTQLTDSDTYNKYNKK